MGLFTLTISEKSGVDVGETEASLNVDICSNSVCDTSKVPSEWCIDELKYHEICTYFDICNCATLLNYPTAPGCGGVLELPYNIPDVPIDSLCRKTCGCPSDPDMEIVASSMKKQFEMEVQQICHYNSDDCRRYLSNAYDCSQEMPGAEDLDEVIRRVLVKHGSEAVRESAQLGDSFMHTNGLDEIRNKVYPCKPDGVDEDTSGTTSSRCLGIVLPVVVAAFWFL